MQARRGLAGALFLLVAAGFSPCAAAAEGTPAPVSPASPVDNSVPAVDNSAPAPAVGIDNSWVDQTHAFLSRQTLATVQSFDDFFGDKKREDVAPAESTVRWRNNFRFGTDKTFAFRTDLRASIRLTQLSRRLRLVFSAETFEDALGMNRDETGPQGLTAGGTFRQSSTELRYEMKKTERAQADLGAGVLVKLPLVTYLRGRYRYTQPLFDNTLARFSPTVFWRTRDGLGQSAAVDFEHRLSDATLLRWANSETTTEISSGMEWNSEAGIFHALGKDRATSFALGMSGVTRPAATVRTWYALARYRQSVLRDWLFAEFEPMQSWIRGPEGGYRPVTAATFRFEIFIKGERS